MILLRAIALSAALLATADASNTAPTRTFTTEWICDNGRLLRFNGNPREPSGPAWLTYLGERVEMSGKPAASGVRYESEDGKITWHSKGSEGQLTFETLLSEPMTCKLKSDRPEKARK